MINNFAKTVTSSALVVDGDRLTLANPAAPYSLPSDCGGYVVLLSQSEGAGGCQVDAVEVIAYSGFEADGRTLIITERGVGETIAHAWGVGALVTQPFLGEDYAKLLVSVDKLGAAIINNSSSIFDHNQTLNDHETRITATNNLAKNNQDRHTVADRARDELARDVSTIDARTKTLALAISSALETDRAFRRENGCDGVHRAKAHAGNLIDDETYGQTHDVSYSAINHHNHWDTSTTNGIAQFSVSVAGVYIQMRHTDYSRRQPKPKGSNYLETEVIDYPGVPLDITGDVSAQVETAKQYILAREDERLRAGLANFKDAHQVFMAYIEVCPERLSASELETFVGTRHQLNASNEAEAVDEFAFWDWTGLQDPQQNYSNFPLLVHGFDDNGEIAFGSWKARVCFAPIGSYEDYPLHEICAERDDIMTRLRSSNYDNSWKTRFQVKKNKLREMIEKIPGLDGYGADIKADFSVGGTSYQVDKFGTQSALNAAYYHDRYALKAGDADGRSHKYLGFSRSSFVAHNTREEILPVRTGGNIKRISIMHPLELVVVDFRQHWNPLNIQNMTGLINYGSVNPRTTRVGRTEQNPQSGYMERGLLFYKTPAELYSGVASVDPADTASAFLWIKDGNGDPKRVSPSGVPPYLPPINGKSLRQRWFIYDVYDEGSLTHREMLTRFAQQDTDLAAAVINNSLAEFNNSQSIAELSDDIKSLTAYRKYLKERSDDCDFDLRSMSDTDNDISAAVINSAVDILNLKQEAK